MLSIMLDEKNEGLQGAYSSDLMKLSLEGKAELIKV
jgi:hypothetical protein